MRVEAGRQAWIGRSVEDVAAETGVTVGSITRTLSAIRSGNLSRVAGKIRPFRGKDIDKQRFRLAQLLLGALTEERFGREKEELTAGRLTIEDHRLGRTDTDYRVLNGGGRPIFRINIKFHGTAFDQAQDRVGLAPEDCFPLATYKIHQALTRQSKEALPYVFLVLSCLGLTARSVSALVPEDFTWFVGISRTLKRDVEEAAVAKLLSSAFGEAIADIRHRIAASEFRVISASRAEKLLKDKLFDRVFALRQRAFAAAFGNAELNMHFSLTQDMVPIRQFLTTVATESPQRLTVLLDRGEIA